MSKAKKQKNGNKHRALSAQQTIPYIAMHPDGICQIPGGLYTKTLEYEDINYAVASTEDQTAIISGWSACLNYFDSSLPFQRLCVKPAGELADPVRVHGDIGNGLLGRQRPVLISVFLLFCFAQ